MLDGRPDRGALPGGTGHRVPLDWAADIARHREILLAGGLGADDVGEAIATVRPAGVDASSRLERAPGEKDPDLVRSFVLRRASRCGGPGRSTGDERDCTQAGSTAMAAHTSRKRWSRRSRNSKPR